MKDKDTKEVQPIEQEFEALDKAVNELSKQTAALLSDDKQPKGRQTKPTLPRKNNKLNKKGKSFDIIQKAKPSARPGYLKTSPRKVNGVIDAVATESETPVIKKGNNSRRLIKRAAQSDVGNESLPEDSGSVAASSFTASGSVNIASRPLSFKDEDDSSKADAKDAKEKINENTEDASREAAPENINVAANNDKLTEPSSKEAAVDKSSGSDSVSDAAKSSARADLPIETGEPSGELFANNLVEQSGPNRYQPHKDEKKPAVFDTDEYHPQLTDWSKLSKRSYGRVVTFALLLLLSIGILMFVYFSDLQIPFIK